MSTHLSLSLCKKYAYIHVHNERQTCSLSHTHTSLEQIHMRTDIYREGEMFTHREFSVPVCTCKHIHTYLEKGGESCSNTGLLLHVHKHICIYTYTQVLGKRDLLSDRHAHVYLSICTHTHIHIHTQSEWARTFHTQPHITPSIENCIPTALLGERAVHTQMHAQYSLSALPPIHTCRELFTHILSLALSIFLDIHT